MVVLWLLGLSVIELFVCLSRLASVFPSSLPPSSSVVYPQATLYVMVGYNGHTGGRAELLFRTDVGTRIR